MEIHPGSLVCFFFFEILHRKSLFLKICISNSRIDERILKNRPKATSHTGFPPLTLLDLIPVLCSGRVKHLPWWIAPFFSPRKRLVTSFPLPNTQYCCIPVAREPQQSGLAASRCRSDQCQSGQQHHKTWWPSGSSKQINCGPGKDLCSHEPGAPAYPDKPMGQQM